MYEVLYLQEEVQDTESGKLSVFPVSMSSSNEDASECGSPAGESWSTFLKSAFAIIRDIVQDQISLSENFGILLSPFSPKTAF